MDDLIGQLNEALESKEEVPQEQLEETQNQDDQKEPSQEEQLDNPPGWKPYDKYIEEGGDPDMYRGKAAYTEYHNGLERYKTKYKEKEEHLLDKVDGLLNSIEKDKRTAYEKGRQAEREALEQAKKQAREDMDFESYDEANERLNELDKQDQPETFEQPPIFKKLLDDIPALNHQSEKFNPDFHSVFLNRMNQELAKTGVRILDNGRTERPFSELELQTAVKNSLLGARDAMPHLFNKGSKRNAPPSGGASKNNKGKPDASRLSPEAKKWVQYLESKGRNQAAKKYIKSQLNQD